MDPTAVPDDPRQRVREQRTPSRRRGERAATLVEYALIVAVFAVGTIAAIDLLSDGAAVTSQNTADNISSGPRG